MQQLLVEIVNTKQMVLGFSQSKRSYIAGQSLISNIGASTRIENAILTDAEIEWIDTVIATEEHGKFHNKEMYIKDKLSKDKARSIEEVAGYRDAIQIILDSDVEFFPLSINSIKGLHREMLKYHTKADYHLGDYKKHPNSVVEKNHQTKESKTILKTADPGIITETSMADLVSWYNNEIKEYPWPLVVATEFVFRFLAIHPFQDGNGRLSRILFHLALVTADDENFKQVLPYISLDRNIEQKRAQYYLVLQKCSGGNFNPDPRQYKYGYFLDFMIDTFLNSLNNIQYYSEKYNNFCKLSETSQKILACFKEEPERNIKISHILKKVQIPRRTILYSLNQLKDSGFIQKFGSGAGVYYRIVS